MNQKTKNSLVFAYLAMILCWQCNAFATIFGLLPSRELYIDESKSPPGIADFVQFYTAGKIAQSPERLQAYDYATQKQFYDRSVNVHVEHVPYTQYMPFMFAFVSPFTFLPINYAWFVWSIIGIACGVGGLYVLISETKPPLKIRIALLVLLISTCPAWLALRAGQFAWFLTAILCLYSYFFLKRKDILCGIMLALSTAKPQYILLTVIPVLARKRIKVLIAAAVTEAVLFVVGGAVLGFQNILNYPTVLKNAEIASSLEGVSPHLMVSLRGPLTLLGVAQPTTMSICLAFALVTAVILFWLAKRSNAIAESDQDRWLLALAFVGALAFSAHTHFYDMLIISVVGALTIPACLSNQNAQLWRNLLIAFPAVGWLLFLIQPITYVSMAAFNVLLVTLAIYMIYKRKVGSEVVAQKT